jgi:hypothetical protein
LTKLIEAQEMKFEDELELSADGDGSASHFVDRTNEVTDRSGEIQLMADCYQTRQTRLRYQKDQCGQRVTSFDPSNTHNGRTTSVKQRHVQHDRTLPLD